MHASIPANLVGAGYLVPPVCSRHGEPAVKFAKTRMQSRPPSWAYALLIFGALPYLIAVTASRKTVIAPEWPFCAQCNTLRVRRLVIGLVVVAVGAALPFISAAAASTVAGQPNRTSGSIIALGSLFGIFVLIGGAAVAVRSSRPALARAQVSRDGAWVEVRKPDGRFTAQVATLLQQGNAQQGYPRQGYVQPGMYQQFGGYGHR